MTLFRISDFVLRIYTRLNVRNLVAILRTISFIGDYGPREKNRSHVATICPNWPIPARFTPSTKDSF